MTFRHWLFGAWLALQLALNAYFIVTLRLQVPLYQMLLVITSNVLAALFARALIMTDTDS